MEGYFPVYKYCEMTGVKSDTAYHRAERGTVDSFKDKDGRWFLYFCDEQIALDGFIPLKDFSKLKNIPEGRLRWIIKRGDVDSDYLLVQSCRNCFHKFKAGTGRRIFIHKDAPITNDLKPYKESKFNIYRPGDDYLTVAEWSKREGVRHNVAYNNIRCGAIDGITNGGHVYIHKSVTMDTIKGRKKERHEWLLKTRREALRLTGQK